MAEPDRTTEQKRLDTLDKYNILDTAPEQGFDDVVLLAREVCKTPIALVSLVSDKRQWFKAVLGLELSETPIEQSVCAHALQHSDVLVIPDLTKDIRTRSNTLVTGEPFLRFYAGAVLRSRLGIPIGTVCVIDVTPRPEGLTQEQKAGLEGLARQVIMLLEMRRALIVGENTMADQRTANDKSFARAVESERLRSILQLSETRLRLAQEAGRIGTFEVDLDTDIMTVTEEFCRVFGLPTVKTIPAVEVQQLVHPDDMAVISDKAKRLDPTMPLLAEYRIRRADTGETIWISRRAQFFNDEDGKPVKLLGTVHDISDRRKAEGRQDILNQELSHRLKNTLALVQAIASQTLRDIGDRTAVRAFNMRIDALSRAHDVLLQQNWSRADMREVITGVLGLHSVVPRCHIDGSPLEIGPKAALTLSLLLHELATNAIKYGALSVPDGYIDIVWKRTGADVILTWSENGGPAAEEPTKIGLGSRLIDMGLSGTGGTTKTYSQSGFRAEFIAPMAAISEA